MMKKVTIAALAAACAMGSYAHAANLITNGSFEDETGGFMGRTDDGDGAQSVADVKAATGGKASWEVFNGLPGWRVESGPGIELQTEKTLGLKPKDGAVYAELDSHPNNGGNSNSRIEQILKLDVGSYKLSFWFAPRTGDSTTDGINFGVAGDTAVVTGSGGMINGAGDNKLEWKLVTYDFEVTTAGLVSLFFVAGGTADTLGGFIDNIHLEAVPLPGAAAFLLTGLAGLGIARRKRAA